ncbi:MAG: hypothetical protein IT319_15925 [Anaerolineae bacterium]|nr:hypothetical protein [Anaerolineae bacterium]
MAATEIRISPARIIGEVDPRIYGQYVENLTPDDRPIYGGVVDDSGELRPAVIDALREMGVPMIRWGGNYTDVYRWTDGIGPKAVRPIRPNYFWGGLETNRFGTHEFLGLCEALEAQPYISINMGTGSILEALGWLEYCNYRGGTTYSELRKANGRPEPWGVPIWGIGNEAWGHWETCFAPPEDYVRDFNQYAQYMRRLDPSIEVVAVGHTDRAWNQAVLSGMRNLADYLSIHMYGHSYLERDGNYEQLVALPGVFEQELTHVVEDLNAHAVEPIALIIDEWNVRHLRSGVLNRQSPRQMQDALFVAGVFNVYNRFSAHVKAANYVTMVNGNAPLRVWGETVERTPVYEVFRLYQQFMTGSAVQVTSSSASYEVTPFQGVSNPHTNIYPVTVSAVDTAAVIDPATRSLKVALVNRAQTKPTTVTITIDSDNRYHYSKGCQLRGNLPSDLTAAVEDAATGVRSLGVDQWRVDIEPASVAWFQWQLDTH